MRLVQSALQDWIIGIALRWHDIEFSVYREQDRPVDRSGFVQEYWAAQLRSAFDVPKRRS
jgi:hypothetical protein